MPFCPSTAAARILNCGGREIYREGACANSAAAKAPRASRTTRSGSRTRSSNEVHVRAYYDSDGDGVGDFRGLTEKLDYIRDLGVSAVRLLPFCASPLKDEGYDISDYTAIHPMYGAMRDVRIFMREAHARGLRVITELVVNHTSDQHPWFQRSRRAPAGSTWRNFYVWSGSGRIRGGLTGFRRRLVGEVSGVNRGCTS